MDNDALLKAMDKDTLDRYNDVIKKRDKRKKIEKEEIWEKEEKIKWMFFKISGIFWIFFSVTFIMLGEIGVTVIFFFIAVSTFLFGALSHYG